MEQKSCNSLLLLRSDTCEIVRKRINLDKNEDMREAIDILRTWVEMQRHFMKKDFTDKYLESYLISSKGSVEKAKKYLDKMCTMRTVLPEFFEVFNVRHDFGNLFDLIAVTVLPKLTKDHYRVFLAKAYDNFTEASHYSNFFKTCLYLSDYLKVNDYVDNVIIVEDMTGFDVIKFISKLDLVELRHALSISMDCYGFKIKGIHIIHQSKAIATFVGLLKQVLKPKIANRIHVHKTYEEIHKFIDKDILPKEFGGQEKSIREIQDDWITELSSDSFMTYLRELSTARTDEALRPKDQFNETCLGLPGTFRMLKVD